MTTSPARTSSRFAAAAAREFDGTTERSLESLALSAGVIGFLAIGLISLPVFGFESAPISGPDSIGQYAAISSAVFAVLAFAAGRVVVFRRGDRRRLGILDYLDIAALAFAHGVIALLSWTLVAVILEQAFIGAVVFPLFVVVLGAAAAAVTAYVCFFSATHMDLTLLAIVLAVFLAEGVITSMLTSSDPQWWELNLSALGMPGDVSSLAFNLTLIVAGFIVTTLARYATLGVPTPNPKGLRNVRISLVVVGVFLACVGIFHVDDFFAIHTGVASGMAVAYGVLTINLPRWIPGLPHTFIVLGWIFIAVVVLLAVFFAVGYYTLTAVELVAGILVFTWIILFIRNAEALRADTAEKSPS